MKKLLSLIALLLAFSAGAQTVTKDDLIGEWHASYYSFQGLSINFETNVITADARAVAIFGAEGLDEVTEILKSGAESFKGVIITFTKDTMAYSNTRGINKTYAYTLTTEGVRNYINLDNGSKIFIWAFGNGVMDWQSDNEGVKTQTGFKKKQ